MKNLLYLWLACPTSLFSPSLPLLVSPLPHSTSSSSYHLIWINYIRHGIVTRTPLLARDRVDWARLGITTRLNLAMPTMSRAFWRGPPSCSTAVLRLQSMVLCCAVLCYVMCVVVSCHCFLQSPKRVSGKLPRFSRFFLWCRLQK